MTGVFIASSTEARPYAEMAARTIAEEGATPHLWWSERSFPPGLTLVESIWQLMDNLQAAVVIVTPDDKVMRRGAMAFQANSNVLLEYGLFSGRLGRRNVVIVEVGNVALPSDLGGMKSIRIRPRDEHEDVDSYLATEVKQRIAEWLRDVHASSSDGARISQMIAKLAPDLSPAERMDLKSKLLRARLDVDSFAKLPPEILEHLVLKYAVSTGGESVGYASRSPVDYYVDFGRVPPESTDERALAGHLARYVAELVVGKKISPTAIALSKTATQGVLRAAVALLPFPIILVNALAPSRESAIEGFFDKGERAILLHDVALTGNHLIDCITTMRQAGIECSDMVTLTRHQAGVRDLRLLMRENGVRVRAASAYIPDDGRVICGDLSMKRSVRATHPCVLCDAISDSDAAPVRLFIDRHSLPSEVLEETEDFVAISDVSPLAPGHTLIVSRKHILASARLSTRAMVSLDEFRLNIQSRLSRIYGMPTVVFEHGICDRARMSGCGIDHAHLHVLPTVEDMQSRFREDYEIVEVPRIEEVASCVGRRGEYLLLAVNDGPVLLAFPTGATRQYFRRIAADLNNEILWNWNDDLLLGEAEKKRCWILELHRRWMHVDEIERQEVETASIS